MYMRYKPANKYSTDINIKFFQCSSLFHVKNLCAIYIKFFKEIKKIVEYL